MEATVVALAGKVFGREKVLNTILCEAERAGETLNMAAHAEWLRLASLTEGRIYQARDEFNAALGLPWVPTSRKTDLYLNLYR